MTTTATVAAITLAPWAVWQQLGWSIMFKRIIKQYSGHQ
jgi:hypothetical protein